MSVFLIGYRGSGKSTIGRRLADRLWQPFVDVDDRIVRRAGKTIQQIFEQDGEPAFREIESAVMRECAQLVDHVIALGGGSLNREENRQHLNGVGHKVIYLRCEPTELLRRVQADPNSAATRPRLTSVGSDLEEILAMVAAREPLYHAAMTAELDVTNLTVDEAVVRIARMI